MEYGFLSKTIYCIVDPFTSSGVYWDDRTAFWYGIGWLQGFKFCTDDYGDLVKV